MTTTAIPKELIISAFLSNVLPINIRTAITDALSTEDSIPVTKTYRKINGIAMIEEVFRFNPIIPKSQINGESINTIFAPETAIICVRPEALNAFSIGSVRLPLYPVIIATIKLDFSSDR